MKDKMELTIGICVGSSIVSFNCSASWRLLVLISKPSANCCVCYTAACYRWLDHGPRPHPVLRRLRGKLQIITPVVKFLTRLQTIVLFVSVLLVNFLIQYVIVGFML